MLILTSSLNSEFKIKFWEKELINGGWRKKATFSWHRPIQIWNLTSKSWLFLRIPTFPKFWNGYQNLALNLYVFVLTFSWNSFFFTESDLNLRTFFPNSEIEVRKKIRIQNLASFKKCWHLFENSNFVLILWLILYSQEKKARLFRKKM